MTTRTMRWYWKGRWWKRIRLLKLASTAGKCETCGKKARMVAHLRLTYGRETFSDLRSVCQKHSRQAF